MIDDISRITNEISYPGYECDSEQTANNLKYPKKYSHLLLKEGLSTFPELGKPLPNLLVSNPTDKSQQHNVQEILKQYINAKC